MEFIHNTNQIAVYNEDHKVIAEVTYPDVTDNIVNVNHTFVDDSLKGQGIAGQLMLELADELRRQHKKATLTCSYAIHWFSKQKDAYNDILVL